MQFKTKLIASLLVGSGIISAPQLAQANDSTELEQLRQLVQELDQKVKILARQSEIASEDAAAAKKTTPIVKASEKGFGLQSADGQNEIKLRGLIQEDYRAFDSGANEVRNRSDARGGSLNNVTGFHDANDTWVARRLRPTIEGTVFGNYDFRFTEEFAGGSASVVDAYIDGRYDPALNVRIGKYKPFVGLERLQSGGDIKFVERSFVSNNILPNRDQGISVYGALFDSKLNYAVGLNNGVIDGGNATTGTSFSGDKEYTARLFAAPFKDADNALAGLSFGLGGTYTDTTGEKALNWTDTQAADGSRNGLPSYVTDGQNVFFRYSPAVIADGKRVRVTPQASYYNGSFGLLAEYAEVYQQVSLASGGSPAGGGNSTTSGTPPAAVSQTALQTAVTTILPGSKKTLKHDAWDIGVTYLVTGEDASFKGIKPKRDFDLKTGGWGAWELVGRYAEMSLDSATFTNASGALAAQTSADATPTLLQSYADPTLSASKAKTWTAGVNWYLNSNAKIVLNYEQTSFDGGATSGLAYNTTTGASNGYNAATNKVSNRPDERALLARFQVSF